MIMNVLSAGSSYHNSSNMSQVNFLSIEASGSWQLQEMAHLIKAQ